MNNSSVIIQKRDLVVMAILFIITFGLYYFYWLYKTKQDINKLGGNIPTFFLAILPFANIYFDYRYAEYFVKYIRKEDDQVDIIVYFLIMLFLPIVSAFIIQYQLNRFQS